MPGVDGLGVLDYIRQRSIPTAPVLITGYATPEIVKSARDLFAAGIVVKPFNPGRVLSVIHSALASRERAGKSR